jgi:hypothetical protein
MTCWDVVKFLFIVVVPIVSLYLCVERFRESQQNKP